ncbi:hypothetical protein [Bacillus sp. BB56-3]|nr:hypothetical protein [Bacillus sp. BB56-3]
MNKGQAQESTIKKIKNMMKKDGKAYYDEIVKKNKKIRESEKKKKDH